MSTVNVRLTGIKAVVVFVVIVVFVGVRWQTARQALDTEGREMVESWVYSELTRDFLSRSADPTDTEGIEMLVNGVQIQSIDARGPLKDAVVRVELEPAPTIPSHVELIRYYKMSYSTLTGWVYKGPAMKAQYYLARVF